jgi:hypothetical protein
LAFPGNPGGDGGDLVPVLPLEGRHQRIVLHAPAGLGIDEFCPIFPDDEVVEASGRGLPLNDNRPDAQTVQNLPCGSAGVGLFDAQGQGAFGAHGNAAHLRGPRACQGAAGNDEMVFRTQGICGGWGMLEHDLGQDGAAAKVFPFFRDGLGDDPAVVHGNAQDVHVVPPYRVEML